MSKSRELGHGEEGLSQGKVEHYGGQIGMFEC